MLNIQRNSLLIATACAALFVSGCCVTSITSRKACRQPCTNCQQTYDAYPQGVAPLNSPSGLHPAPDPYIPPAPVNTRLDRSKDKLSDSYGHSI